MATVAIVGAGMMGSALAVPLVDSGHRVLLVGSPLDDAIIDRLREDGHHLTLKLDLPNQIAAFPASQLEQVSDEADAFVVGVSSAGTDWAANALALCGVGPRPIVAITKGLRCDERGLHILPDHFDHCRTLAGDVGRASAAIAGPCIAGELARRVPSSVVLTSRDESVVFDCASLFDVEYYRVTTSSDVVGTEFCAALKNAYALGVALVGGIHEARGGAPGSVAMHNLEAAVFSQALREMALLATQHGGRADTVVELAGAGDLLVTLNGGRTSRFGRHLGRGLSLDEAIAAMEGATLECLDILAVMRRALRSSTGDLPLLHHLCEVALDGKPVDLRLRFFHGGIV